MRTLVILFFLSINTLIFSQGIAFETDWKTAREKAKKDKKLIFVDYYADWMSDFYKLTKVLYSDTAIGDYFNQNFIAVRINVEKEEGKRLSDAYNLFQSPRFLFIHADNLDVIKREYVSNNKEAFLETAKKAFQYKDITPLSILQKKYDGGQRDKVFLENLMQRKSLCGINVKEEMKVYLQSFELDELPMTIFDFQKYFVSIEYKSSDYAFFKSVKGKKDFSNLFIGYILGSARGVALDSTFKNRDFALFNSLLNEIRLYETPQKTEYYKVKYAEGDSNTLGLFNATCRYINTYLKTDSIWEIRRQDSLYFANMLKPHSNNEDSLRQYMIKTNGFDFLDDVQEGYKHQKASLRASSIAEIIEPLLLRLKDKKQLQSTLVLTKYAYDLMPKNYQTKYVYALNLYKLGDKTKAINLMSQVADFVKSENYKHSYKEKQIDKYTQCYQKMQQGNL
jgi:Thioredoxin-like